MKIVTMCQMKGKNKNKNKTVFSPSPFQTISIGKFTKQPKFLFSKFNYCLATYIVPPCLNALFGGCGHVAVVGLKSGFCCFLFDFRPFSFTFSN